MLKGTFLIMSNNLIPALPIDAYINEILEKSQKCPILLIKSSPGSGKTTRVPWNLAKIYSGKVLVLEPRKLAARLAAERIAYENSLEYGKEIGHHYRFEKKITNDTKLIFYTEGTFIRRLLTDPYLDEVDVVILDEFHERHVETDIALGALLEIQKKRQDLRIVIMSATLDLSKENNFSEFEVVEVNAPLYPVEINYLPNIPSILNESLEKKIKETLKKIPHTTGHILIFIPGLYEMKKIQNYLGDEFGDIFILHSSIDKDEQNRIISYSKNRKIILASAIAESSVTIPGVEIVIDSGLSRESVYSPWSGLKSLETKKSSQASIIQRTGRAGRTGPGKCFRLYSEQDYFSRKPFDLPEITKADFFDTYLLLKKLKKQIHWITPPPQENIAKAQELADLIGLNDGLIEHVLNMPFPPRMSLVVNDAKELDPKEFHKLISLILDKLDKNDSHELKRRYLSFNKPKTSNDDKFEKYLLKGFINQIAKFRPKERDLIHFSGKVFKIHPSIQTLEYDYYLILEVSQKEEAITIIPILEDWLWEFDPFPFKESSSIKINERITILQKTMLGRITIDEQEKNGQWERLSESDKQEIIQQSQNVFLKKWDKFKTQPDNERLFYYFDFKKLNPDTSINVKDYFFEYKELNWENIDHFFEEKLKSILELTQIDQLLPNELTLENKKKFKVHYTLGAAPFIESYIQDFYGIKELPRILNQPIIVKLLGPHKRPIQITSNLNNFWKKTYLEMRKELMRDYPKHNWPEFPQSSTSIRFKKDLPN